MENNNYLNYLKKEFNLTETENGAITNKSTFSKLLDLFALIGGSRYNFEGIKDLLEKAWLADKKTTAKILIHSRDILNGMGERQLFRDSVVFLMHRFERIKEDLGLLRNVAISTVLNGIGRWDDLIDIAYKTKDLKGADLLQHIKNQFRMDMKIIDKGILEVKVSLLGKWMPSENTSSSETVEKATFFRKYLGLSSKSYREYLSKFRREIKIIENNLREKDYTFDYSKVPSKAFAKYSKAFQRNDEMRYNEFIKKVKSGEAKINTATLTPFDIIHRIRIDRDDGETFDTLWRNLPDMFEDEKPIQAIVAADVSGSMSGEPMEISVGLAIYMAERNKGAFHNHFIDFCGDSQIHELNPDDPIVKKYENVIDSSRDMNTNVDSVFDCLLKAAVNNCVPQEELPKYVIIVSDMEFDQCIEKPESSNFNYWKEKFEEKGYKLPLIVFWNVSNRHNHLPATKYDNVIFFSGRSQTAFKSLMLIEKLDLKDSESLAILTMMETLKKYDFYLDMITEAPDNSVPYSSEVMG